MNIQQIKQILDNAPEGSPTNRPYFYSEILDMYASEDDGDNCVWFWSVDGSGVASSNDGKFTIWNDWYLLSDLRNQLALHEENEKLKAALKSVISNDEINTGYEPSISCFHRSIDEAKELLKELSND